MEWAQLISNRFPWLRERWSCIWPSPRRLLIFLGVCLSFGVLIAVICLKSSSQTIQTWPVLSNMDPPSDNQGKLSQEDITTIKSGLEARQHYSLPSQIMHYDSSWLNPYRYRDTKGQFWAGTGNFNPVGFSLDPPCPYIIWLKGNYGLYFYDSQMPDFDFQKAHPDISQYVELRKISGDNKTKSQVVFVVPMSKAPSQ